MLVGLAGELAGCAVASTVGLSVMRRPPWRLGLAGRPAAGRHQQSDLVLVGRPAVALGDELAAVHDRDPVGHLEDLVELGRHEQHGRAGVALVDHLVVDELDAAHVQAARRLVEDEQLEVAVELARDDDLLLVAARERARVDRRRRRADVVLGDALP